MLLLVVWLPVVAAFLLAGKRRGLIAYSLGAAG